MNCNHRCYECHIPACPDRIRQSIGPRIVPMFADPPEWSADKVYSPLTLVIHNGATYMSRRCVPANTALPDTDPFYNESWVMVYDMNAQVAQYREEVAQLSQQVTDFGGKIDNWEQLIVQWTALIQSWQNQFPELAKDLAAITERVAAIEPKLDQAQEDIAALQAMQQTHTEQIAANTQGLADLTPRVAAAETHLSALDEEQKVQDEHLNNLDASQTEQDTRIQANHDLAVQAKNTAENNTQQITENAGKIAANAAEIAKHAEQLEALKAADTALDGKISQNTAAIAQNSADIAQAKTDIKQAAAAAQQAQDTATHADSTAQAAQELAQQAKDAADAAAGDLSGVTDRVEALETSQGTQDGKITALETSQGTQDGKISALETAQTQTTQDIAALKNGSTELPYVKKVNGNATGTLAVENLTVSGTTTVKTPVNGTDAASKQYVDQAVQNATGGITPDVSKLKQDVAALQESQTTQDSKISAAAQTAQTAQETAQAAKTTADQAAQDVASIKNGSTALPYVKKAGDTMTGDLDMTGHVIKKVKWPVETADATNKAYVDDAVRRLETGTPALPYIKDTGDTVTGTYDFTGADLTVKTPTADASPATKAYVDSAVQNATDPELAERVTAVENKNTVQDGKIDALQTQMQNMQNGTINLPYLPLIGGALTGAVTTNRQSFGENELVTKQYVDSQVGNTGEHGHLVFTDAIYLAYGSSASLTKQADEKYCLLAFVTEAANDHVISAYLWEGAGTGQNWGVMDIPSQSQTNISFTPARGGSNGIVIAYKFVQDGDQPTPPPDPTTSFTTLSGDYSSTISVQGTGSNKASNTEALQSLVDGTKGNLYKFTDHAGTAYWFTCANAVTMTGDTVTVADCDYVVGNGTTVYSGGTLVFKAWQASPADQFTQLNGPYTVNVRSGSELRFDTETAALNYLLATKTNHYKVTNAVSKITFYIATNDTFPDGQQFTTVGYYVASNANTLVMTNASITLIPYKPATDVKLS